MKYPWTRGISTRGWIGIDLDSTLAHYAAGQWPQIGLPVQPMLDFVKDLIDNGHDVRIMTARVGGLFKPDADPYERQDAREQKARVEEWCEKHIGKKLVVTAVKDYDMALLYDDRAVTVEANTGRILTEGSDDTTE